jgi:hypothetical protein
MHNIFNVKKYPCPQLNNDLSNIKEIIEKEILRRARKGFSFALFEINSTIKKSDIFIEFCKSLKNLGYNYFIHECFLEIIW